MHGSNEQVTEVRGATSSSTLLEPDALRVLLVEDCPTDAFVLMDALNRHGVREVTWVSKLSDAMLSLQEKEFDVIVTDVRLPDALGVSAIVRLREHAPDVPLVVCSGSSDDSVALRAIELGAQEFVAKSAIDATFIRSLQVARVKRSAQQRSTMPARTDALTGLASRAAFSETIDHWVQQAKRDGSRFAVIVLDLDDFETLNGTYGHAAGDELLREVASRIQRCLPDGDVVARTGGDEFAFVAADLQLQPAELKVLTDGIALVLALPFQSSFGTLSITTSIGTAAFPDDARDAASLLGLAEVALYAAKWAARATPHVVMRSP